MNPLTNMKNLNKMNDREIELGTAGDDGRSWHAKYKDSAWVFVGGLPYTITEGDVICVFSQYGEVVNLNLVRDRKTGKSKGYCFLCYEDQRSTNVAVDNFNGIKIAGRTVRVDHVDEYRVPKIDDDTDETIKQIYLEGCAPKPLKVLEPQIDSEDEAEARRKRLKLGEDGLIKLDENDVEVKQIKKARKAARKAERLAQREERQKRKLERRAAREELRERGTINDERWRQRGLEDVLGDMKPIQPTSSFFKESKPDVKDAKDVKGKAYTEFDDEDFKPEHLVKMNYFEKQMVAKRYMGPQKAQTTSDWREEEIVRMELDRKKRKDVDEALKRGGQLYKGDRAYVPKRFDKK